ncbi:MAG: hypothetical protein Q9163_004027 [Psora crenata]
MNQNADTGNVFAIPDLWQKSALADFDDDATHLTAQVIQPLVCTGTLSDTSSPWNGLELRLPDLSSFTFGPLEDAEALEGSSVASSTESIEITQASAHDLWPVPTPFEDADSFGILRSWERFNDKSFGESRSVYISEQCTQGFDALLLSQADDGGHAIQSEALLAGLLQLGIGRESILYHYDQELRSFRPHIKGGRMCGYSLETFHSLSVALIEQGNSFRHLRSLTVKTQSSRGPIPALVAFGGEIFSILSSLETQIVLAASHISSLLQLQWLFVRPAHILACLNSLTTRIRWAKTDEDLISWVFEVFEEAEQEPLWLRQILSNILAAVSSSWREATAVWIGLRTDFFPGDQGRLPAFVGLEQEVTNEEKLEDATRNAHYFVPSGMPSFISEVDARSIFEIGQSLRLLRAHLPDHPLAKPTRSSPAEPPPLEWQFRWRDIEKISERAKKYEDDIREAIKAFNSPGMTDNVDKDVLGHARSEDPFRPISELQSKKYIQESIAIIERPLSAETLPPDGNTGMINTEEASEAELFDPPVSLLPSLSFQPFFATQARLVNRACLRLLVRDYDISAHFSLLYRYSFLGDGEFASRLSHALFDPDFNSAERHEGHPRTGASGLRLGYRDNWPPASSELRLALMGILTDSYMPTGYPERAALFREELPGGLSFAIREMSEEELQQCIDPNSIKALDFLRLQYRAPSPVNVIITPPSLTKYDALFKLLLRAHRMLFVVNQLSRDMASRTPCSVFQDPCCQRFRIEGHHFISALCTYFFESVSAHWEGLKGRMRNIATAIERDCVDSDESLPKLRDFHEHLLDRMMFTLLLRKRQAELMKLLEEIFSLVLRFASYIRTASSGHVQYALQESYNLFQKKTRVFMNVCRGLNERRGEGGSAGPALSDANANEAANDAIGSTLTLNGIPYYIPATPFVTVVALRSLGNTASAGALTPVTVIGGNAGNFSIHTNITAAFSFDDVWNEAFLGAILIPDGGALTESSANSSIVTVHLPIEGPGAIPPGPYFASASGALYRPYRLYSDIAGAFTQPLIPASNGTYAPLPAAIAGIQEPAIGVPSRLYYTVTASQPLAGVRLGVKDIYDIAGVKTSNGNRAWYGLYPAANTSAVPVQRLIDAGAVIVGKMKTSQFANGETATADWVDYHSPFNPRGDGYQDPSSSSSGPGAGAGSYPWLDLTLGSDTGGSIRGPSQVQGLFGNRPTHGLVDLTGVMPLAPQLDTAGFLTRDPNIWSAAAKALYGDLLIYSGYPKKLYTLGFPTSGTDDADSLLLSFLTKLEGFLSANTTALNLTTAWSSGKPASAPASLDELLNITYPILISKEQTMLVRDPFYAQYAAAHDGRRPFVNPAPLIRWAFGDSYPASALTEAIKNKTIFQEWWSTDVQRNDSSTCSDSLVLYAAGADPVYRNEYSGPPRVPYGFGLSRISVFAEVPDFVVPSVVGQAAYNSTITLHEEFLPVTVDIMAAKGCDGVLFKLVQDLQAAGIVATSLTGQTITGGEILLRG